MKTRFGCDPENRKLSKILFDFFLVYTFLILSTQIIAEPKTPEKENPTPYHQKFPVTDIDVSQEDKNISDASEAVEYLNRFVKQRLNFSDQETFKISQEHQLAKGYKSYRFQHFYQDISVEFNDLILSISQDGNAKRIWGYAWPVEDVDIVANLSGEVATKQALKNQYPDLILDSIEVLKDYELVILLKDHESGYLAYKSDLRFKHNNEISMLRIYVDANTGLLLETLQLIHHAPKRVIFETPHREPNCLMQSINLMTYLDFSSCENPTIINSQSLQYLRRCEGQPAVSIPKVDNLYDGLGKIYRFLEAQGYDSFDKRGHPLVAGIFNQTCYPNAVYYQGKVGFHPDYANDLIVVGHELMHGVIDYSSQLVYRKEPGALNESLSDIFGVIAKFWIENNGFNNQPLASDYLVSDIRDMSNPTRKDQPDFYPDARYLDIDERECGGENDNCGVHINSGIVNLAFYLLAEGGQHPQQKTSVQVPGIGMEKAFNIFFETQKDLSERTDFREARRRLATRAEVLYDSEAKHSVNLAFDAVGVPALESPQIPPPEEETPSPEEGDTPDDVPPPEDTPDDVPPPEQDTSENDQLLLMLLALSLLLLFFALNIRKNKTSANKVKDVAGDSFQSAEKTWMLSDYKTNQSISLSVSKLMLPDGIVVGRSPQFCHSTFPDKHLSSRHARFSIRNNNLSIEDLNTANGTYVNGVKIKPFKVVKLEAGNEVKLARCRFSVDYK